MQNEDTNLKKLITAKSSLSKKLTIKDKKISLCKIKLVDSIISENQCKKINDKSRIHSLQNENRNVNLEQLITIKEPQNKEIKSVRLDASNSLAQDKTDNDIFIECVLKENFQLSKVKNKRRKRLSLIPMYSGGDPNSNSNNLPPPSPVTFKYPPTRSYSTIYESDEGEHNEHDLVPKVRTIQNFGNLDNFDSGPKLVIEIFSSAISLIYTQS